MKRCDHLPLLEANPGKIRALREVLAAFRAAAPDVAADQWRRLFETGRFTKVVSAEEEARSVRLARAKARIGAVRLQMLRFQVVGQLESFLENRANDFRDTVVRSSLDETTRHQLLTINRLHAWFQREAIVMRGSGEEIPEGVRHLARRIMRRVLAGHRRPRFNRLNPWIDQRQARVGAADRAARAPLWAAIRGMRRATGRNGKLQQTQATIQVPLRSYAWFEARGGAIAKTIQLIERGADRGRPGELVIGVVSDMEGSFGTSRAAYQPLRAELALDFGLSTMFATGEGDLLGRAWFDQLKRHDARIAGLARRLQRQGIRPNRSRRYRTRVAAFRGFLKTEIGRVLNRLVALKRPARIVIEKLDFRAPGLSRRLNRILARSGRAVIREKLKDLADHFGIAFAEVNPAYSSQTRSACGFVARANRRSQSNFSCRACGHEIHADVNAARNLEGGRSAFDREARLTKAESLRLTVHRHLERDTTRGRVTSARVFESPYYRSLAAAPDTPLIRTSPLPDVVADVSAG
jgi:putative transposase